MGRPILEPGPLLLALGGAVMRASYDVQQYGGHPDFFTVYGVRVKPFTTRRPEKSGWRTYAK